MYGRRVPTAMKVKTIGMKKADTDSLPGIQLNDRQMKLYAARKSSGGNGMKEQNHSLAPPPPAKKPQYYNNWKKSSTTDQQQPYLGREPTQTAETVANTFSEDSGSISSRTGNSSRSRKNATANAFYGQRLDPSERKMYDDSGNTWKDSRSEASSSASAAASSVSAALSSASRSSRASRASSRVKKASVISYDASGMSSSKATASPIGSTSSMARLRQLQKNRSGDSSTGAKQSSTGYKYSSSSRSEASVDSSSSKSAVSVASSTKMSCASRSVVSSKSRYASTALKKTIPAQAPQQEDEIMSETATSTTGSSYSSAGSQNSRPGLSVKSKSEGSFSQQLAERNKADETNRRPSGLGTEKEKSKFLRNTMMKWAKPTSSMSSAAPSALRSTKSSTSTTSKSSKSSRRLSFAPKKAIITGYSSPRSAASGRSGAISPKEMAIMRKVADRNRNRGSKIKAMSPNPRRAAGKLIKSSSMRMKKLLSSPSFSSSSSSLKEVEEDEESASEMYPKVETVTSNQGSLFDDRGGNGDAISLLVDDAPDDEAASIASNESQKLGEVDRRRPIVIEEDVFQDDGEGDDDVILRNLKMRKKSKRGRSSIFKARIGNIGMGVMDDLIDSNDNLLSSDDDEEEFESEDESTGEEEDEVTEFGEAHDVSIHQARSIKSVITPRKLGNEEPSPRNIDSILEENKDFLKTMRKGPLKQALKSAPAPTLTMSESYDEDQEEYRSFTRALKAELSGTHSKLYDSFQAMFRCGEHDKNEPPKPLSVYPGSLDLNTKDCISKMSKYLNTEHDIECQISSQIVKDVDVRNFVPNHERHQKSTLDTHRSIQQVPSTDSISGGDDGSQFEVTVSQHIRKSASATSESVVSSTNDSRYLSSSKVKSSAIFKLPPSTVGTGSGTKFNQIKLKSRNVNGKSKNASETVPSSWTKVRLKPVGKPKTTNDRPNVSTETSSESGAGFHRIVLRKTPTNSVPGPKKKQFDASIETVPSSLTDASGTENKPIDLEKTGDAPEQPIKLTTPTPATMAAEKKKTLELSPVSGTELKPISLNSEVKKAIAISHLSPISGTDLKPIAVTDNGKGVEENPIELVPSKGYDDDHPIQLVPSKGDESANPILLAPSIDLDLNEGSVMVPLVKEKESGINVDINVIVGKNGITKVQSIPGQAKTKANVVWRLERLEVKSALLDMSTFSVKVIVSSDSNEKNNKDLQFPTSTQCMKFANALHEMKNSDSSTSTGCDLASIDESSVSTGAEDTSVYIEQLSDEEQKILDEFRRRKNDPLPEKWTNDEPKPMSVVNGNTPSSPVSEVSAATSATPTPSQVEKKYELMLKMKVPKEAVKGKMEQDGVEASIIAKVLGGESPNPAPAESNKTDKISSGGSNLSPEDEKKATVYRTMLKMMIPPEAVEHKMKKEGVDPKIVAAVLGNSHGQASKTETSASPSLPSLSIPEQAAAQKYQKMLKMNVPKEGVEHQMKKDGVDEKIIAFVLGQSSNVPNSASAPVKKKKPSSSLTSDEESTASIYRRMLKMNIPRDAVHHKMSKDGVSENIISAVLGKNIKKDKNGDGKKGGFGAGFHWNAIDDNVSIVGSVWSKTKTASEVGLSLPDFDISKHVEEFQKKPDKIVESKKSTGKSGQGIKEMANLVNNNRAQNVAITLKAFNDFSYKELSQNIEFLDPYGKIKGDRALFMKDLLPTPNEVKAIKAYTGSDEYLDPAEKWFQQIVNVKRIEEKVQVMRTIETIKMDAIVLGKSFELLTEVCNQVMSSDRLPDLLDMVRQIGNRMNEGRGGDDAAGFKLDFLPRLSQTKGSDKKTSALDLVVLIFCTRNQREALMLSDEYPDIQEASRMQFDDLTTDVRSLEASFRQCKTEFENLKQEYDASHEGMPPKQNSMDTRSESNLFSPPRATSRKFTGNDINSDIGMRTPSNGGESLIGAIKSRNGMVRQVSSPSVGEVLTAIQKSNEEHRKSLSPRASLRMSIQAKDQEKLEYSLEASIRRLEKFVGEASYVILPKLQTQRDAAKEACNDLASFFCEKNSDRAASNLLKILAGFATGIDQAVRKYDERQKILARREAAMLKKRNQSEPSKKKASKKSKLKLKMGKKRPAPEVSVPQTSKAEPTGDGEKKSLVLMVNEMLKVAGDKDIEDYVSGNTNASNGSRLGEIYEEEKARKNSDKGDILSAIKRRRSVSTNLVPQQALSDLSATLSRDSNDESNSVPGAPRSDRRKGRVAQRWSSKKTPPTSDASNGLPPKLPQSPKESDCSPKRRRGSRIVNRWSSKPPSQRSLLPDTPVSEALTSISETTHGIEIQQKRRQSVVNRWASSSHSPKAAAITKNLDDESDIGAFQELIDKRKQKALNRWGSKK